MISSAFINNGCEDSLYNDECNTFLRYLNTCTNDITESYLDMKSKTDFIMMESEIMGEISSDKMIVLESENKNFIEKIGAKVIEITKKFAEFIGKIIDKIKDMAFRFKSNEKKMDILLKEHPELAKEKIQILCDEGGLEFNDIKSLSELDKEFDKIIKLAKEGKEDPDSLKARWRKASAKWINPDDDRVTKIKKVTGAVTGTIALVTAIAFVKKQFAKNKQDLTDANQANKEHEAMILDMMDKDDKSKVNSKSGYFTLLLAMHRERNGCYTKATQQNMSLLNRITNSIASVADKVTGSKAGKVVFGDLKTNYQKDLLHSIKKNSYTLDRKAKDSAYIKAKETEATERVKKTNKKNSLD